MSIRRKLNTYLALQVQFGLALAKFHSLRSVDLCANVDYLGEEDVSGYSLVNMDDYAGPGLEVYFNLVMDDQLSERSSNADVPALQRKATRILAERCPSLRHVYWSGSDFEVAMWNTAQVGRQPLASDTTFCEARGQRSRTFSQTYHSQRSFQNLKPTSTS